LREREFFPELNTAFTYVQSIIVAETFSKLSHNGVPNSGIVVATVVRNKQL